jgi:hypothetical protein
VVGNNNKTNVFRKRQGLQLSVKNSNQTIAVFDRAMRFFRKNRIVAMRCKIRLFEVKHDELRTIFFRTFKPRHYAVDSLRKRYGIVKNFPSVWM